MNLDKLNSIAEVDEKELVEMHRKMKKKMDELSEAMTVIRSELLDRLISQKRDSKIILGNVVSVIRKLSFTDTPLSYAREMGAVKEAVDSQKLNKLYASGVKVQGVKISEFVAIRELEKPEKGDV